MIESKTTLRVRYSETDQMGYVYYGNYAQFFEVARVEMLRELGVSYKSIENEGVMLPVLDFSIHYNSPAFYDDALQVVTQLQELPTSRIHFTYKTLNDSGKLLNTAQTTLVFVNKETGRPTRCPAKLLDAIKAKWKS